MGQEGRVLDAPAVWAVDDDEEALGEAPPPIALILIRLQFETTLIIANNSAFQITDMIKKDEIEI